MAKIGKRANTTRAARRGPSRRTILAGGVAAAAISGFPYVSRGFAAQTLKFWQFYAPGGGVATQDKWFEDVVKGWNDSHEVKVELVYVPNNAYMDGTKLPTAFASGSGPDLFIISPGDFLRYYNGGVLLDLTPFMEKSARDDFFPSVIANRMVDGKIYGLPYEVEPMAMYYSVDAFNEIGLTDKDVPKTWEELLSVAKKLTNAKRFGVLFETSPGYYQNFTWYPFLWEAGGDFQTKDGKSAFNSPATVQALKFWQDSINMGVAPRKPLGGGAWDAVPNIWAPAIARCRMSASGRSRSCARARPISSTASSSCRPLPAANTSPLAAAGPSSPMRGARTQRRPANSAPGRSARRKTARFKRIVDWCTKAKSDMPPTKSALEGGKAAFQSGFLKVFTDEIYPGARAEPRMPPQVYKAISDAIQSCQLNGQNPKQAAAAASDQIDAFLAGYKGAPIL